MHVKDRTVDVIGKTPTDPVYFEFPILLFGRVCVRGGEGGGYLKKNDEGNQVLNGVDLQLGRVQGF